MRERKPNRPLQLHWGHYNIKRQEKQSQKRGCFFVVWKKVREIKENWKLSYAGVELPPPTEMSFTLQPIDDAERNADGDMFIQTVALKKTIGVGWERIDGEKAQDILNALIQNREGKLVYYDPSRGGIDQIDAYYGAGASTSFYKYDDDLEKQRWTSLKVNFIEM